MPRYTIDTYTSKVRRAEANGALVNMTDADVLGRISREMLPTLSPFDNDRIWDENEPEHSDLASAIRSLAARDLNVMFGRGDGDTWCDERLGSGFDTFTGFPILSVVYDNDNYEDVESYRHANPVNRLRALGICEKQIPEVDGYTVGVGLQEAVLAATRARPRPNPLHNVYVPATFATTTTAFTGAWNQAINDLRRPTYIEPEEESEF